MVTSPCGARTERKRRSRSCSSRVVPSGSNGSAWSLRVALSSTSPATRPRTVRSRVWWSEASRPRPISTASDLEPEKRSEACELVLPGVTTDPVGIPAGGAPIPPMPATRDSSRRIQVIAAESAADALRSAGGASAEGAASERSEGDRRTG